MDIDFAPLLSDEKGLKALSEKMETAKGDDRKMTEALKRLQSLKIQRWNSQMDRLQMEGF